MPLLVVPTCAKRFHRYYSGQPTLLNRHYRGTTIVSYVARDKTRRDHTMLTNEATPDQAARDGKRRRREGKKRNKTNKTRNKQQQRQQQQQHNDYNTTKSNRQKAMTTATATNDNDYNSTTQRNINTKKHQHITNNNHGSTAIPSTIPYIKNTPTTSRTK